MVLLVLARGWSSTSSSACAGRMAFDADINIDFFAPALVVAAAALSFAAPAEQRRHGREQGHRGRGRDEQEAHRADHFFVYFEKEKKLENEESSKLFEAKKKTMPLPILTRPPAPAAAPRASAAAAAASGIRERVSSALVAASIALLATTTGAGAANAAVAEGTIDSPRPLPPPPPPPSPTKTKTSFTSTPFTDLSNGIDYGLTSDGRIRACPGAIPNCTSTSSTTDLYAPALLAEETTPAQAAQLLDAAVAESLKGSEKIFEGTASRGPGLEGIFLQYEVPGASGRVRGPAGQPTKDVVEVLLRPEKGDTIATYRSTADPDSIRFLPLLQQPLSDQGAQKTRMRALLVERLGWKRLGCDNLDCFMEEE